VVAVAIVQAEVGDIPEDAQDVEGEAGDVAATSFAACVKKGFGKIAIAVREEDPWQFSKRASTLSIFNMAVE
jgi:hypothetical protein